MPGILLGSESFGPSCLPGGFWSIGGRGIACLLKPLQDGLNHLSIALMRWCHREIALPRIVETADHCEVLLGGTQFSLGALISELCDRGFELGNQPRAF